MKWLLIVLVFALPLVAQPKKILVEGHRGARWVLPENTLPAFHHAIEMGADVLELDLAVTKDDVLVVSHDLEMKPSTCRGPEGLPRTIRQLTLAEVKQFDCGWAPNPDFPTQQAVPGTRMPTLDEVLGELGPIGSFHFNIETKTNPARPELTPEVRTFAKFVVDAIRKHKVEKRVKVQSFDFRTLLAMKEIAPDIELAALYGTGDESFAEVAKRAGGVKIVSPNYHLVTPEKVRAAHAAGLVVVPWTVNAAEDWQKMIDANVDSIITDNPQGLVLYLQERKLH